MTPADLPPMPAVPLPNGYPVEEHGAIAKFAQDYARLAIEADRKKRGDPVAEVREAGERLHAFWSWLETSEDGDDQVANDLRAVIEFARNAALPQRTDQQAEPVAWWVDPPYLDGNHITTDPYEQVRLASRSDVTVRPLVFGNAAPPADDDAVKLLREARDYVSAAAANNRTLYEKYPSMERRWKPDAELLAAIDAYLAKHADHR
jgi:hypothetical protein